MSRSRWSESYRHYEGTNPGLALAEWLNESLVGGQFIQELLADAKLVCSWLEKYNSLHSLNVARKNQKLPKEFWEAHTKLNETLGSLIHAPHIDLHDLSAGPLSWMLVTDMPPAAMVSVQVRCILQLIDRNTVDRVRRCAYDDCAKWYFAGRSDQEFCSPSCRWHAHSEKEAFKKRRREYQRKLYHEKVSGKVK